MTLRHFRIFVAVCKQGGITKAAESLYLAQPAVSLAVRELEEHYDVRLFDRIGRRLYLTEAGKEFWPMPSGSWPCATTWKKGHASGMNSRLCTSAAA